MRKKTNEEFLADVAKIKKGKYTPLEPYIKSNEKIKVRHNSCGRVFYISPNTLLKNEDCGCPQCFGNNARQKTNEEFIIEVKKLVGDEYTFNEPYVNRTKKLSVTHNICNSTYAVTPANFLLGTRCVKCAHDKLRLSKEEAQRKIEEHIGTDFEITGEYINMQKPIEVLHKTCGSTLKLRLTDVINKGTSCKNCNMSNGEKLTQSALSMLNIPFETQKSFEGLVNKKKLSYDFYLPTLNVVIEYQGEQHFRPKNFGGTSKEKAKSVFELQLRNDEIKRAFAKENKLTLIEIPYTYKTLSSIKKLLMENLM